MKKVLYIFISIPKASFQILKSLALSIIHFRPIPFIKNNTKRIWFFLTFVFLLLTYLIEKFLKLLSKKNIIPQFVSKLVAPPLTKFSQWIYGINRYEERTINRINLIELALRNMQFKFTRTIITIGGMSVGIAAIVFLVSLGYGLQRLVIDRVARLEEMQQIDVTAQVGSRVAITDEILANFNNIEAVNHVLPLIAVVGRINFQNSVTDSAVYGVTTEYLKQSAFQPVQGKLFESDDLTRAIQAEPLASVLGIESEQIVSFGQTVSSVQYSLEPDVWVRVRENPDPKSKLLGYTRRVEGVLHGEEVWGERYPDNEAGSAGVNENGKTLGKWIKSKVLLWEQKTCDTEVDFACEEGQYKPIVNEIGLQKETIGYIAQLSTFIEGYRMKESNVLSIKDENPSQVLSESEWEAILAEAEEEQEDESELAIVESEDGFVEIGNEEPIQEKVTKVTLGTNAKKEVVVNRALLSVLGLSEGDAIGKEFELSFVITADQIPESEGKIESIPASYKIVGVDPGEDAPFMYVPFIDLRSLGIANYTQVKLVAKNQTAIFDIRKKVEAMGFATSSVVDTVVQIDRLFGTVRLILASIGMVALGVAALGMFNTMSVSLLERTREVGLMKAMGMKSHEVRELFLTESMIMGLMGGLMGISIGMIVGKMLSVLLTVVAVTRGVGVIDISYLPVIFIVFIMTLSTVVGIVTGIYPARRATQISALNALRYE